MVASVAVFGQAAAADTTPVRYLMTVEGVTSAPFAVQSFSWGISNPHSFGGSGAGRPSISSFNIMKLFDNNSPGLIALCDAGTHSDNVRLRGYRGTSTVPFIDVYMTDVYVESEQMSASTNVIPTEAVSFAATTIAINGVTLSQEVVSNPVQLNKLVASLMQKPIALPAKQKAKVAVR